MAQINIALNTETREVVLVIDGQPVAASEVSLSKYLDWKNNTRVDFRYMTRTTNNGMEEIHGFYLPDPPPSDADATVAAQANSIQPMTKAEASVASRDIANFMKSRRD